MTIGRCAGCGFTHVSCQKVRSHVTTCPKYIELFKTDRAKCLDPTDEYIRWKRDEDSPEAKADAKELRLATRFAELDSKRVEQVERWQPRDLLDD